MAKKKSASKETLKSVATITHGTDKRKNIPTVEYQSVVKENEKQPIPVRYPRNKDLDPQLMWRGKDEQDWSDLVVHAPPLYIQEKVHPKVLIDDLLRQTEKSKRASDGSKFVQLDLFSDFNGVPEGDAKTEFYQHDQNWTNRMILGDSLQVMASLAEREGLRGKVQCIYFDPPYGIKFNSNFQWSTTSRDVKDGKADHITREPEQVKAFRDTWRDGIHSYLTYLRDRLTVARDLLADSGSIFVQIGDENVHRVRAVLDEVFGNENIVTQIAFKTTTGRAGEHLSEASNYLIWYARSLASVKFRNVFEDKLESSSTLQNYTNISNDDGSVSKYDPSSTSTVFNTDIRLFRYSDMTSARSSTTSDVVRYEFQGKQFAPGNRTFRSNFGGLERLRKANRISSGSGRTLQYHQFLSDFPATPYSNVWVDTGTGSGLNKLYVVQTNEKVIQRCILMATDPGDIILDPTCGSGTTATVAEQWGRRWITIDTSRVALALARTRIMGARYPYFLLADSKDGQAKEAKVTHFAPSTKPVHNNIRLGFVYERVPHITLKSIANNAEIDVIWDKWQATLEPLRTELNKLLKRNYEEWEIPRAAEDSWPIKATTIYQKLRTEQALGEDARPTKLSDLLKELNTELKRKKPFTLETLPERPADPWDAEPTKVHRQWWEARIARQQEIDASIAAKAEFEYLYDKPYEDKKKVRVAGPFTVESLSPHRTLGVDENDELIDPMMVKENRDEKQSFPQMILENLKTAGVQQAHKEDRISFTSLVLWPGDMVCAEGIYQEGETERRAAIMIGPEFGTVQRQDLVQAAREAGDAGFDVLIACAFNYDAMSTEFNKLGRIPVLKARMNADLHMADDLKNTGKGNLFVIFGEPDIDLIDKGEDMMQVKVNGVDVFHPNTGEVRSDGPDGIACWFIDTDYNEESFFVRHAYFLGQNDPYTALKTTLKAEINADAWSTLHSDTSRPFEKRV
ncbi:MAG: site-specific DNA-methyltransferase [Pirellula sp.]